jgi:CxxC-x17-CxxC domain-containing protein
MAGFRGRESVILENVQAVCSDCGVETEIPFKSIEGHPADCIDCQPKYRKYTKKF